MCNSIPRFKTMIKVKATREGLIGGITASGWKIDTKLPFVALPSTKALHRFVRVTNVLNGKSCVAVVMDVGPWNIHDHAYVFQPATGIGPDLSLPERRPQVESGPTDTTGRKDNNAGIDLGEAVWKKLEMKTNSEVTWEFIDV